MWLCWAQSRHRFSVYIGYCYHLIILIDAEIGIYFADSLLCAQFCQVRYPDWYISPHRFINTRLDKTHFFHLQMIHRKQGWEEHQKVIHSILLSHSRFNST